MVWWCHAVEMTLLPSAPRGAAIRAPIGWLRRAELFAIGIFGFMLLLIIWQATEQPEFAAAH